MSAVVGVRAGLTVDHLVVAGRGARFDGLGGPGLFAALGARLVAGGEVRLCANLPDDEPRFAELFARSGIDVSACAAVPEVPRLWILNSGQGRRIVATGRREVELDAGDAEEDERPLPPAARLGQLDALLESAPLERPTAGARVVGVDPHQLPLRADGLDYLERVATPGSVLLPSRVQLTLLDPDPLRAARLIRARLGLSVVARLDGDGMVVLTDDGEWSITDPLARVVETTGAGDASAGAIVAALGVGADPVTAARYGASVARLALADWGHAALLADPLIRPFPQITVKRES